MMINKHIAIVYGGPSSESEVSKQSAFNIRDCLIEKKHEVSCMEFNNFVEEILDILADEGKDNIVVFNAMHGLFGEDGRLQGFCDILQLPYTHSNSFTSALCIDKNLTKKIAQEYGVNVIKGFLQNTSQELDASFIEENLSFPLVIKPNSEGSSVGVYLCKSFSELEYYFNKLKESHKFILIEQYIKGKELTVAVVQGKALAVTHIVPKSDFYDYESKYEQGGSTHIIPAQVDKEIENKLLKDSEILYNALGIKTLFRCDYILDENNNYYLLEVNTHPGFTQTSLLPEQANYNDISFYELCCILINGASYES